MQQIEFRLRNSRAERGRLRPLPIARVRIPRSVFYLYVFYKDKKGFRLLKRDESLIFRGTTLIQTSAMQTLHFSSVNGDEPLSPTQNSTSACPFSDKAPRSVPYIPLPPHTTRRLSENKTACTIPFPCIFIYILLYQKIKICQALPMIS